MPKNRNATASPRAATAPPAVTLIPRLLWLAAATAWALLAASMLSFHPADPPSHVVAPLHGPDDIANWIGPVGAAIAYHVFLMLGPGAWILLAAAGAYLAHLAWRGTIDHPVLRGFGVLLLALAVSGFHAVLAPSLTSFPEGGGGLAAIAGTNELTARFGVVGACLWLALLTSIGAVIAFDRWLVAAGGLAATITPRAARALATTAAAAGRRLRAVRLPIRRDDLEDDDRAQTGTTASAARRPASPIPATAGGVAATHAFDPETDGQPEDDTPGAPQVFDTDALRQKIARLPVHFAAAQRRSATDEDLAELRAQQRRAEEVERSYVFPGLDLLLDPEENFSVEMESLVRQQAEALEQALHTFRIRGEVVGIDSGPVITLYQVRLAPGTKVSSITSVSSDIARALRAVNVRIVPNTEGLDTVGVEVPNPRKERVRIKELMTNTDVTRGMRLPLFLGKDASGNPLVQDLADMPHLLIAGTTGSGKSVCMNSIIVGFLYTQRPSDLKLVMVDPKMVELSQFKDVPHLMCPVITEMAKAAAILEWAVTKMDERYELLADAGCRDIAAYNELEWDELVDRLEPSNEVEEAKIPRKLPYIVFVIDELADLMMTNKEVESSIVRIAQKARAVGIHLILATQRPQANVVTGLIKSNMPARIAFKVSSGMDSRIVLDQKGGELLLGQGDMLMLTPRSANLLRAQGTLVDDREIRRVVRFVRDVSEPSFERALMQIRSDGNTETGVGLTAEEHEQRMRESAEEDPLFNRAVEIVLESRRGSVSLLQRRLAIGYTRASRLIELMGIAGIIGDHKGTVAREVTMTLEEWHAMRQVAEADAATDPPRQDPGLAESADDLDDHDRTDDTPPFIADAPLDDVQGAHHAQDDDDATDPDTEAEYEYEDHEAYDDGDDYAAEEDDEAEEYEYEYVDEDGNPIDPEDAEAYEYEDAVDEPEDEVEADEDDAPEISTEPLRNRKRAG